MLIEEKSGLVGRIQNRINRENRNFLCIFVGGTGSGKCQPAGSKVLMSDGEFKNIEEIKKGDRVISLDKNYKTCYANVIDTSNWKCNDIYEIYQKNRDNNLLYRCSNNHLVPIVKSNIKHLEIENMTAEEIFNSKKSAITFRIKNYKNKKAIFQTVQITSQKTNEPEQVYGISIDSPTQLYVTDNFLVTHNTYSALRFAEQIDPTFNIDRVVFTAGDFLNLISDKDKLKTGNAIIFDDAGVGLPAREWYRFSNRSLNYLMQSFRYRNLAVIFTTPSMDYIDVGVRKLFHMLFETQKIDRNKNQGVVKPFFMEYNSRTGQIYYKFPRMRKNDGGHCVMNELRFNKPGEELIKQYETKRDIWASHEYQKMSDMVNLMAEKIKSKDEGKKLSLNINDLKSRVKEFTDVVESKNRRRINITSIQANLGISHTQARVVRRKLMEDPEIMKYLKEPVYKNKKQMKEENIW